MGGAGMTVENSKGECNLGQHEINFRYGDALRRADDHAIYKNGAKEIAAQEEHVDHLHGEVQRARGQLVPHPLLAGATTTARNAFAADQALFERFVAGQLACMRELTLLYAPHVNSYKRFAARLLRADRDRLGQGQPHLLAAGGRPRRGAAGREPAAGRRRQPLPGAERDDRRRPARDRQRAASWSRPSRATPTSPTSRACPHNIYDARDAFAGERGGAPRPSAHEVVDHYLNRAQVEIDAFEAAVTDWERFRGFERL